MTKLRLSAEDQLAKHKILPLSVQNGRAQMHGDGVLAVDEVIVHTELVRDVHIFAFADLFAVEVIFGDAVNPFKNEIDVLALFGRVKGSFIPPFVILELLGFENVVSHKKILGKIALAREIKLYTAGDRRRQAERLFICRLLALTAQFPGTV